MTFAKKLMHAASVALLAGAAAPAFAAYQVLDGWELLTPVTDTKQIGRLNLVSGTATVNQEVDGTGNAFVNAKFTESGQIFSVTYTKENVVGAGDSGSPSFLGDFLTLSFTNVAGHVTALNPGGGFKYVFDSGNFAIAGTGGSYASGTIVGLGGNSSSTAVIGGINGDSTVLGTVLNYLKTPFDFKDSAGVSLQSEMAAGNVLFEAVTNNNTTGVIGAGACSFVTYGAGNGCVSLTVASAGDAYLVRKLPEPGSLLLGGLALVGLGFVRRRQSK
ncbi:hypothetical protein [Roseateles sp. P5_E8]